MTTFQLGAKLFYLMASINSSEITQEPATTTAGNSTGDGNSDGLTKLQIHFLALFILAFLCLVFGIINVILHKLGKMKHGSVQREKLNHLPCISASIYSKRESQKEHASTHLKGNRKKFVTSSRSESVMSTTKMKPKKPNRSKI